MIGFPSASRHAWFIRRPGFLPHHLFPPTRHDDSISLQFGQSIRTLNAPVAPPFPASCACRPQNVSGTGRGWNRLQVSTIAHSITSLPSSKSHQDPRRAQFRSLGQENIHHTCEWCEPYRKLLEVGCIPFSTTCSTTPSLLARAELLLLIIFGFAGLPTHGGHAPSNPLPPPPLRAALA